MSKGELYSDSKYTVVSAELSNKNVKAIDDKLCKISATIKYTDSLNKTYIYNDIIIKKNIYLNDATDFIKNNDKIDIYYLKSSPILFSLNTIESNYINIYILVLLLLLSFVGIIYYVNKKIEDKFTIYSLLFLFLSFILFIFSLTGYTYIKPEYVETSAVISNNKLVKLKNNMYNINSTITYVDINNNVIKYDNVVIIKNIDKKSAIAYIKNNKINIYYLKLSPNIYLLDKPSENNTHMYALLFFISIIILMIFKDHPKKKQINDFFLNT